MPHIHPQDIGFWLDITYKTVTFIMASGGWFQAWKANKHAKVAIAQGAKNGTKIDAVHEQVNGRMSEVLSKVPDQAMYIGGYETDPDISVEKDQASTYTGPLD